MTSQQPLVASVLWMMFCGTLFSGTIAFAPNLPQNRQQQQQQQGIGLPFRRQHLQQQQPHPTRLYTPPPPPGTPRSWSSSSSSTTRLFLLLDVPDAFFTVTFPMLGILLSISKSYGRVRMEENAWEQRLAEGRVERLRKDPTLTELDLRRKEAALEWSAYGKPRMQEEEEEEERMMRQQKKKQQRVKVMDREDMSSSFDDDEFDARQYRMTEEEIKAFELEYGVDYDPYYDDPYAPNELPEGKFDVDKRYGDRIYENGEIFYKDAGSGLFYRQGAKPRNLSFWR